jgi:hypothetical protein
LEWEFQVSKKNFWKIKSRIARAMICSAFTGVAGVFAKQCERALLVAKQTKKEFITIHFNAQPAKILVWTIFKATKSYGPCLVKV